MGGEKVAAYTLRPYYLPYRDPYSHSYTDPYSHPHRYPYSHPLEVEDKLTQKDMLINKLLMKNQANTNRQ